MQTLKSVFGVMLALVPVAYCGGLLYYFIDLSGSVRQADEIGLGPTVLGLAVVGLLFSAAVVVKIVRIFITPRPPGSGGRGGPDGSAHDDHSGFDADAAIARYMARQSAEAATAAPSPAPQAGGPARPAFGRKIR
jgi:hypothetical protein